MSTSLAEQLRRLATPQTSLLHDGKKRATILFDPREAAEKDRETIYDIGLSGLHELIEINSAFSHFELTLFERTSKDMERAIENTEMNKLLNRNIKKFMLQLSPYFLLQSTHKCLEWLIRRFHIHLYNEDEIMMLILPYHETKMFAKILQLLKLRDTNNRWHWLHPIQKLGIPLAKQTLFNRTASDSTLMKFICKLIIIAVKELDIKASTLQTIFSFYYITIIGALETVTKITDTHISDCCPSILKGLESQKDFCAGSLMIIMQIIRKIKLSKKLLEGICTKLSRIIFPGLHYSTVMVMIMIYKTQDTIDINPEILYKIIENKWVPSIFGELYKDEINIMPLYEPLILICLKSVQLKDKAWKICKQFTENLLIEINFSENDAELVITCILNGYVLWEENEESIITIDSDNDDNKSSNNNNNNEPINQLHNFNVNMWYSNLLKNLVRQYPEIFDKVIKEIMHQSNDKFTKKSESLKTILGFIYSMDYSLGHAKMFENLYHYNALNRIEGVKYLVNNYETLLFSDDYKDLLNDCICERLNDTSPLIVSEILQLPIKFLLKIIGTDQLINYLFQILTSHSFDEIWEIPICSVLEYLTSKELLMALKNEQQQTDMNKENQYSRKLYKILITIFTHLFPLQEWEMKNTSIIIKSEFAKQFHWLNTLQIQPTLNSISQLMKEQLQKNINNLCDINELILTVKELLLINDENKNIKNESPPSKEPAMFQVNSSIMLLTYSIPKKCSVNIANDIFKILSKCYRNANIETLMCKHPVYKGIYGSLRNCYYPIELYSNCLDNIVKFTNFQQLNNNIKIIDFSKSDIEIVLLNNMIDELIENMQNTDEIYIDLLRGLLQQLLPTIEDKIEYFSNYFICEFIDNDLKIWNINEKIQQIRAIRVFNALLQKSINTEKIANKQKFEINLNITSFIRILNGLCSQNEFIRQLSHELLKLLSNCNLKQLPYSYLIKQLLNYQEELLMDSNQLSFILYMIYNNVQKRKYKLNEQYLLMNVFNEFFEFISTSTTISSSSSSDFLTGTILHNLQHIKSSEILLKITNCALNILNNCKNNTLNVDNEIESNMTIKNDNGQEPIYLNHYKSIILKNILLRYSDTSINFNKLLKSNENCWLTILNSIKQKNIILNLSTYNNNNNNNNNKFITLQIFVLQNIFIENNNKFFNELSYEHKNLILKELILTSTIWYDTKSISIIRKFMKNIEIDCKLLIEYFQNMIKLKIQLVEQSENNLMDIDGELTTTPLTSAIILQKNDHNVSKSRKSLTSSNIKNNINENIFNKIEWKCGVSLLEHLQNKRNLQNISLIIPYLFDLLRKCIEFDNEESTIEYTKQLILSCILYLCKQINSTNNTNNIKSNNINKEKSLLKNLFQIEFIIQCIRTTKNPQTQHHALLLLELSAHYQPEKVLHNMMNIFTFMGSSIVRHDDEYSFQIILKIISTIIPTLMQSSNDLTNKKINIRKSLTQSQHEQQQQQQLIKHNDFNKEQERKQIELILPILKVFTDVILDIPEHRRIPLYKKLIQTLNNVNYNYLWMFLSCLFESHVRKDVTEKRLRKQQQSRIQQQQQKQRKNYQSDNDEYPKRMEIALELINEFDCNDILLTCINLLNHLQKLPNELNVQSSSIINQLSIDTSIFNLKTINDYQLRHYKYIILLFIKTLTNSSQFLNKISVLNDNDNQNTNINDDIENSNIIIDDNNDDEQKHTQLQNITQLHKLIIIKILEFIYDFVKLNEQNSNTKQFKTWKIILNHCYDILENAVSLLTPKMLLIIINKILNENSIVSSVQRKIIEILNNKLQYQTDYFINCNADDLLNILKPLIVIIETMRTNNETTTTTRLSINEHQPLQHNALIAIKLLSKLLANKYPMVFKKILETLTDILRNKDDEIISINLRTAIILCLAEICSNLKAHSISYLSKFMPLILTVLERQSDKLLQIDILHGILTGLHKIIETLALFLSPYLVNIISHLSKIWFKLEKQQQIDSKITTVLSKLNITWEKLAIVLPLRVLIPAISQSYENVIKLKQYDCIEYIMKLLTQKLSNQTNDEIQPFQNDLITFFMITLRFRCEHQSKLQKKWSVAINDTDNDVCYENNETVAIIDVDWNTIINKNEDRIIQAFITFILKLSESSFRPLYYKMYDWAMCIDNNNVKDKILVITFYKLSWKIAESLKSLFILFANDFIKNSVELLNQCNTINVKEVNADDNDDTEMNKNGSTLYFADRNKCLNLIEYILQTLNLIFLHANQGFINSYRFDIVMQPIVDQLDNYIIHQNGNDDTKKLLTNCLGQLAIATNDDTMWKILNYQILLKTRNNNSKIRLYSLMACVEVAKKLGENFLPLLPETVPFIAELLEDENFEVEKACKTCVHELEKVLGEPLQKYF